MIYTKTGDKGMTSLIGGQRVSKADQHIEAYGTIDELNAFIGYLHEKMNDREESKNLLWLQKKLFDLGGYLASDFTQTNGYSTQAIDEEDVKKLETAIDTLEKDLPRLKHFILPGGGESASLSHICRTISRRAERCIYRMEQSEDLDYKVKQFINRLSDYFFLLARKECFLSKRTENYWTSL